MSLNPSNDRITSLPLELFLQIVSYCRRSRTMFALSRTSRTLHALLAPTLTTRFAQRASEIIHWALRKGRMEFFERALAVDTAPTTIVSLGRHDTTFVVTMVKGKSITSRIELEPNADSIQRLKDRGLVVEKTAYEFVLGLMPKERRRLRQCRDTWRGSGGRVVREARRHRPRNDPVFQEE